MKQLWLLFLILPVILWTSCETETLPSETPQSLAGNILSRNNSIESLPEESKILLNARGGMTIEDKIFTYNGSSWSNDNGYQWENANETTYITALHPHDISNLYEEDTLKDILIAQDTLRQGETDITLTFKHLFASFTLNVEESLIDDIAEIKLTSPKLIERVSFSTGEIMLSDNPNTTTLEGNGNNSYEFIIPPMEASLSLGITLKGGTSKTYTLQRYRFNSGFVYECTLRDWNTVPGIRSAEDFITFYNIINGTATGDTLKYGTKQADGRILFRLLSDIDLSGKSIYPLFNNSNKPFNHIFNGEGYTISNFKIIEAGGFAGLFGTIGKEGVIKNLKLKDYSISIPKNASAKSGVGSIAGLCNGTITNCGIINGDITNNENSYTGGIVGVLHNGIIINSFVNNSTIKTTNASLGGIVGKIETGNVINCFSASNTITRNTNYCGGFCGFAENGNIINCYVYNLTFKNSTKTGQFIGHGIYSNVTECYTDTGTGTYYLINKKEGICTTTSNSLYNPDFTNSNGSVYNQLNQWITNNQSSYNYTFTPWIEDQTGTLPAIFTP